MSLKNGIYQLRFVPAGGEPAPGMLAATGEGLGNTVRILPNSPPNFEKQSWKVTHTHGDSYHIAWTMSFGPPFFMCLDGPNGPIMQDTPVMLLSDKQEWLITKGEGENVYSITVADQLIGVNLAIDKVGNDEAVLRRFVVGEPTPQWVFIPANSDAKD